MKYTATSQHNRHFELFDINNQSFGKLDYTNWLSIDATITMANGDIYNITPTNFWQTALEISKNGAVIGGLKMSWLMHIVIYLEGGSQYSFKHQGLLNPYYALITQEGMEIVALKPDLQWSKMSFNYDIETDDNYKETADPTFILFLIYCANNFHRRQSGAVVAH